MDYYLLSEEPLKAADINKRNGLYRMSVHMATLAIELMLKSVLYRLELDNCQATVENLQKKYKIKLKSWSIHISFEEIYT